MAELYPYPRFSIGRARSTLAGGARVDARSNDSTSSSPLRTAVIRRTIRPTTRYLTHVGGGGDADIAAVFPLEGEVTAIATSAAPRWPTVQDWTNDVREARRNYGRVIVQRLKELSVEHGRIGITGLGEVEGTRTPEGTIFYGTWKQIREAFPHAELVDATAMLTKSATSKARKSLTLLRKSMEIIELAIEAEIEAARPGVERLGGLGREPLRHDAQRLRDARALLLGVRQKSTSAR